MGKYIAEQTVKKMIQHDIHVHGAKVGILGFTFKENCPDVRNTKVIDIINELKSYCMQPVVYDPVADTKAAMDIFGVVLEPLEVFNGCEIAILAVAHDDFDDQKIFDVINNTVIFIDIKNITKNKIREAAAAKEALV